MSKRSYQQYCGLARALDVVGERWTLLILRNLLIGPQRYTALQGCLPGITTNLLAKRLREMEAQGLILKEGRLYRISPMGLELEPAIMALGRFGQRYLAGGPRDDDTVELGWGMVSLKRRYRGTAEGKAVLAVGERSFLLDYSPSYVDVREGETHAPLVVSGTLAAFRPWLFMGQPPRGLSVSGPGFREFCGSFGVDPQYDEA